VLKRDVLMMFSSLASGDNSTIGKAGGKGFGVGVYPGDKRDLDAMGLSAMEGVSDPLSPNYGNYQHTNGSIMCCVPAFCYRLGNSSAPSYSRDGVNALEIRDASEFPQFKHNKAFSDGDADFGDGWILHRAFIDGGKMKNCFFMDKYLCSNNGSNQAASIKNADWLMCSGSSKSYTTKTMGGDGCGYDAITFSRARGDHYSLTTVYQWSAMAMLSLAHGQAATSSSYCAWYDPAHTTNFPKGATNDGVTDYNDSSIKYNAHSFGSHFAKTGSSNNAEKVSHNGQLCGIMDVAGMCNQWCIGATNKSSATVGLMKLSVSAHDFTKDNRVDDSLHETFNTGFGNGNKNFSGLRNGKSGTANWASCGVIPISTSANSLFGNDEYYEYYANDVGMKMGLGNLLGENAGVFCRGFRGLLGLYWNSSYSFFGFRASGYAP
jgi:hypothetical protein